MTISPIIQRIDTAGLQAELERRKTLAARTNLSDFVKSSWHVLEPTTPLLWNWHLDAICQHIQAALDGWIAAQIPETDLAELIQNLLINVPPGSAKSRVLCVCAVAWMWLKCPQWRVICISSNPRVALRDAIYCRDLIQSKWYQERFKPEWSLSEDQNAKSNFRNTAGGFRMAVGVGAKITGDRADALFIDDPHDAAEISSDVIRQGVLDWWDQAAWNRVNNPKTSIRIGIMQRLHEMDWAGHILMQGGWEHLAIAQEFVVGRSRLVPRHNPGEEKRLIWIKVPTKIGWEDPRKNEGELMFSERFPAEIVAKEKTLLGSAGYSGQHQQDPTAAAGNKFKRAWFQYFTVEGADYVLKARHGIRRVPIRTCNRIAIGDFAFSIKTTADFTVIGTFDITPDGDMLIVSWLRKRMEDPDVERAVISVWDIDNPLYVGIENKQNGATIIQRLIAAGKVRVRAIEADTDKITRSIPAQVDMENGKIFLPDGAAWLPDFEAEILRFPNGVRDDQVDVLSYAAIEKGSAIPRITSWGEVTTST